MVYSTLRYVSHEQALGPKTYAGKSKAACGNYHQGKECLDIHLLKAAAHEAVAIGQSKSGSGSMR